MIRDPAREYKIKLCEISVVHFVLGKNHRIMSALHGIISDGAYILSDIVSSMNSGYMLNICCMLFNGDE